jgi:hypothetical protein
MLFYACFGNLSSSISEAYEPSQLQEQIPVAFVLTVLSRPSVDVSISFMHLKWASISESVDALCTVRAPQ